MRLRASPGPALQGSVRVPGDKSMSHRALLLGAMAVGECRLEGLLEGADVLATATALGSLGVPLERADAIWRMSGVGVGGLAEADRPLDLGNAGTAARLLLGVLAGHPFTTFVTGDESLRARPMGRVIGPLSQMGARFTARSGNRLPLAITGTTALLPLRHEQTVASAQIKSAILLAGLHAPGHTTVIEPQPSRDHTERLLRRLGAGIDVEELAGGGRAVTLVGQPELAAADLVIPGDPSSAAFPMVAAAATAGATVRVLGVGTNPLRTGLFECLREMGVRLHVEERPDAAGEPVADLTVEGGELVGIDVPADRAPRMIDEYPILAVAAACARGRTRLRGLAELRVKESDRLAAIARGLDACGVAVEEGDAELTIHGAGAPPPGGGEIAACHDHRIAMSFLVLGGLARAPVVVSGAETIDTSFPGFADLMNHLGARIERIADG